MLFIQIDPLQGISISVASYVYLQFIMQSWEKKILKGANDNVKVSCRSFLIK